MIGMAVLGAVGTRICFRRPPAACSWVDSPGVGVTPMITEADFNALAADVARLNDLPLETAKSYLARVADARAEDEQGRAVVFDDRGRELVRLILPAEE